MESLGLIALPTWKKDKVAATERDVSRKRDEVMSLRDELEEKHSGLLRVALM